jgi:hypothetical protein
MRTKCLGRTCRRKRPRKSAPGSVVVRGALPAARSRQPKVTVSAATSARRALEMATRCV